MHVLTRSVPTRRSFGRSAWRRRTGESWSRLARLELAGLVTEAIDGNRDRAARRRNVRQHMLRLRLCRNDSQAGRFRKEGTAILSQCGASGQRQRRQQEGNKERKSGV